MSQVYATVGAIGQDDEILPGPGVDDLPDLPALPGLPPVPPATPPSTGQTQIALMGVGTVALLVGWALRRPVLAGIGGASLGIGAITYPWAEKVGGALKRAVGIEGYGACCASCAAGGQCQSGFGRYG